MNNKENVCKSYDKMGDWFDENRSQGLRLEKKHLQRFIAQMSPGGKILDLGCGSGRPIAQYLLCEGFVVKGIDGSRRMVELAQQYVPSIQPELQDMRFLKLSEKFDGIILWHSSFHLPADDQRKPYATLHPFLNPGGSLLFTSGPGAEEVWAENGGENIYHASLSQEEYKDILQGAGFELVSLDVADPTAGGATVWLWRLKPGLGL